MSGTVGQFVRAMVEVDAHPLLETVKVGCGESSFLVELVYENLPFFCSSCKMVGHSIDRCHKLKAKGVENGDKRSGKDKQVEVGKPTVHPHRVEDAAEWRTKEGKRRSCSSRRVGAEGCQTSNNFEALADQQETQGDPRAVDILEWVTVDVVEELQSA